MVRCRNCGLRTEKRRAKNLHGLCSHCSEDFSEEKEVQELASLVDQSRTIFGTLNAYVANAESATLTAASEYRERAFAPFWESVEAAAKNLASYRQAIIAVNENAAQHASRASWLSSPIQRFNVPHSQLVDARPVADQLSDVVRKAQRDFEFATIYEQRKTNQLIIAGFDSLSDAITHMGQNINDALSHLSGALSIRLDELISESERHTELLRSVSEHMENG
jgi:uncharacterized protein YyaL (SSP411 family)